MVYGKEIFGKGVYGVINTTTNKITYVGSTNASFATRWGFHSNKVRFGTHCNKQLTGLFESGNFEFIILDAGNYTNREILDKEKYYTDYYDVYDNGYCDHVGGGRLQPSYNNTNKIYDHDTRSETIRLYIEENWFNVKIYQEDKATIEKYITDTGIKITKFMAIIKHLGFVIQRYSDKKSWLISDKLY